LNERQRERAYAEGDGISGDEFVEKAEGGGHDGRVAIAQYPPEPVHGMRKRRLERV
jgi:hypothetical protein